MLFPLGVEVPEALVDAYTRQLKLLMPPGRAFTLEKDATDTETLRAMATEYARVHVRAADLLLEMDPRTAAELLSDWERALSLPDDRVFEISTDDGERRVAITQKYNDSGGQNYAFFETLCADCGYPLISIGRQDTLIFRVGSRVGSRCGGPGWGYAMVLNVENPLGPALSQADFERVARHATHGHISVLFTYT